MYKSIVIVAVLAAVSLLAVACGSESGTTTQAGPGIGDTLRIAGNSSRLEVTLEETRWLPAEESGGVQVRPALFGAKLAIGNVAGSFYDDAISLCAVLADSSGRTHNVAWELVDERDDAFADVLEAVRIPAGGERAGWVYFALDPEAEPATLRYTAEAGFGPETGVWTLE